MKVRVTIDLKDADDNLDEYNSLERGVFGCDEEGIYHRYYGSRHNIIEFEDVEVVEEYDM